MNIQVISAESGKAFRQFLNLPWSIYRYDPYWVPPLKSEVKKLLAPAHPFYRHAERALFLALDGQRPVGRVAAILNHRHNEFHGEKTGFFGFFESVDSGDVAAALLEAAEGWLAARGMETCRGPVNPSTNEECGLLVENFLSPPFVMMTYNPPYYGDLLEGCGYLKAMDLFAYWYHVGKRLPEKLAKVAARVRDREKGLVVRPLDVRNFDRELEYVKIIYNEAWEKNWGFVPMTDEEINHMARQLKPIVLPEIVNLAFIDGEPAGFVMGLPDFNQVLKILDGTLLNPVRTVKALRAARRIKSGRCLTLGVREKFRKRGIESLLFAMTWQGGIDNGYRYGEFSWILENNEAIHHTITRFSPAERYKTYRIYDKPL